MATLLRAPKRQVRTLFLDSRRWNGFEPRDNDIVIGTFAKCGTTWTQRIVDLLVFKSADIRPFGEMSPWLDANIFNPVDDDLALLKAQTHRRYIKSHLPFDALPLWDTVKYIHVGRDGRDASLSWQNHVKGFTPEWNAHMSCLAAALAAERGDKTAWPPPRPPKDPHQYLIRWFEELEAGLDAPGSAGSHFGPHFFDFEASYWRERDRPNLLLVHYNDLKEDLSGEMRRIADFLDISIPDAVMPGLVDAARFETMKRDGAALYPSLGNAFDRGADRFLHKGRSGRWRDYLNAQDVARYEAIVQRATTPRLGRWLEGGRKAVGDPELSVD